MKKYYVRCMDNGRIDKTEEYTLENVIEMVNQLNHYSAFEWDYVEINIEL